MNMLNAPRRREGKPVGLKPKQARKEKAEFSLVHWAKTNPKSERPTWLPSPLRRPRRRVLLQSSLSSTAPAPSTSPQPPPRLHQLRVFAPAARDLGGMRVAARSVRAGDPLHCTAGTHARDRSLRLYSPAPLSPGFEFLPRSCCFYSACCMYHIQV